MTSSFIEVHIDPYVIRMYMCTYILAQSSLGLDNRLPPARSFIFPFRLPLEVSRFAG